jgi:ribose transport system substrate-binding protein
VRIQAKENEMVRTLVILSVGLALLLGGGCNKGSSTPGQQQGKKFRLAFVTNNSSDFWSIARAGCVKAASELPDVDMQFKLPGDGTVSSQLRIVNDLLAGGIDGIAMSPIDPANQGPTLNKIAAQALLLTTDSDAPDSDRTCYVGTDNIAAGRQAGEIIRKALPSGGKIMLFVGTLDAQNAHDRRAGIEEVLKDSNVKIIDTLTDNTDRQRAKANAADTLTNYPDIAALVGLWSYNGPQILHAVQEANKVGQVKIICFDEEDDTLTGVKNGAIVATVVQQPFQFGYQSISIMEKILKGDKSMIPPDRKIIVPTLVIQKDSVDDFWAKLKQLRGH